MRGTFVVFISAWCASFGVYQRRRAQTFVQRGSVQHVPPIFAHALVFTCFGVFCVHVPVMLTTRFASLRALLWVRSCALHVPWRNVWSRPATGSFPCLCSGVCHHTLLFLC